MPTKQEKKKKEEQTSLDELAQGQKPDFIENSRAREKVRGLKEKAENLFQGPENPLTQGEAEKQTQLQNKIEQIAEQAGIDPSKVSTPTENDRPTTVGIETGVTKEQVKTGEAKVINARDEAKETKINAQRKQDFIKKSKADEFTVKPSNQEQKTISREQALNRLEQTEQKAASQLTKTQELLGRIERIQRNQDTSTGNTTGDAPRPVQPTQRRIDTTKDSNKDNQTVIESSLRDIRSGGLKLMNQGEKFAGFISNPEKVGTDMLQGLGNRLNAGSKATEQTVESFQKIAPEGPLFAEGGSTALAVTEDVSNIATKQKFTDQQQKNLAATLSPLTTKNELQAQDNMLEGAFTLGTQAGGFFTAGAGSAGLLLQDTVEKGNPVKQSQKLGQGVAEFTTQFGSNIASKPSKVFGQEVGEEFGETAAGFAVGGGLGGLFGAVPTPEITPSTPSTPKSAETTKKFIQGDLGFRATEKDVVEKPFESLGAQGQTVLRQVEQSAVSKKSKQEFEMKDESTRIQKAVQVDSQQDKVKMGQRTEEKLSRTQFVKERIGLTDKEMANFLSNSRKGQLNFDFNTETDPSQSSSQDLDLFTDNVPESEQFTSTAVEPKFLEPGFSQAENQNQGLEPGQQQKERQRRSLEEIPEFGVKDTFDLRFNQQFRSEPQTENNNRLQPAPEAIFGSSEPSFRTGLDTSFTSNGDQSSKFKEDNTGKESQFAPSLDAILSGTTITEKQAKQRGLLDETFSGLETRPIIVERDKNNGNTINNLV